MWSAEPDELCFVLVYFQSVESSRKPTWVSLIYRTETTTKKCKTEKLKSKNGYAQK